MHNVYHLSWWWTAQWYSGQNSHLTVLGSKLLADWGLSVHTGAAYVFSMPVLAFSHSPKVIWVMDGCYF